MTAPSDSWQSPPAQPTLRPGEVHLWRARLDAAGQDLRGTLSAEEWVRAGKFVFERDRNRYVATRGLLRAILGRYVGLDPRDLRFAAGAFGKPELAGACSSLRFNLSHSHDLLLVAVTYIREVGVDVERLRDNVPFEMLAEHYFEPEDAWHIRLLPAPQKVWKFYDVWTSTEARLKAHGRGLSGGTRIVQPDRWSLLTLTPADGYAAAIAVEGGDFQLQCWSWPS
jgi:4'-phosphopantetheinyl transferase